MTQITTKIISASIAANRNVGREGAVHESGLRFSRMRRMTRMTRMVRKKCIRVIREIRGQECVPDGAAEEYVCLG